MKFVKKITVFLFSIFIIVLTYKAYTYYTDVVLEPERTARKYENPQAYYEVTKILNDALYNAKKDYICELNEIKLAKIREKYRQKIKETIQKQPVLSKQDCVDYFKNDIFIGDSLTDELRFYGYVGEQNVIAKLGLNTSSALSLIENYKGLQNPDNIYVMLGLNDAVFIRDKKVFLERYEKVLDLIRSKFKDAKIHLESILPITKHADEKPDARVHNARIDEFNSYIKELAKKESLNYIEIGSILTQDSSFYEPDGIHFVPKFHRYWLTRIKNSK